MSFTRLNIAEAADETTKRAVWAKGAVIEGFNPLVWRRDICGHAIKYDLYGQTVEFGWEIDHIRPVARGGADTIANYQPLFWENNRTKGDKYPWNEAEGR